MVAEKEIRSGDCVVEYRGDLINQVEAKSRLKKYIEEKIGGSFMYYFKFRNETLCVDATTESGHLGRLINHSRSHPNLHPKVILMHRTPKIFFYAKRMIKKNEELLYDYGDRNKESIKNNPWLAF